MDPSGDQGQPWDSAASEADYYADSQPQNDPNAYSDQYATDQYHQQQEQDQYDGQYQTQTQPQSYDDPSAQVYYDEYGNPISYPAAESSAYPYDPYQQQIEQNPSQADYQSSYQDDNAYAPVSSDPSDGQWQAQPEFGSSGGYDENGNFVSYETAPEAAAEWQPQPEAENGVSEPQEQAEDDNPVPSDSADSFSSFPVSPRRAVETEYENGAQSLTLHDGEGEETEIQSAQSEAEPETEPAHQELYGDGSSDEPAQHQEQKAIEAETAPEAAESAPASASSFDWSSPSVFAFDEASFLSSLTAGLHIPVQDSQLALQQQIQLKQELIALREAHEREIDRTVEEIRGLALHDFEREIEDSAVLIDSIPLATVIVEEKKIEFERVERLKAEQAQFDARMNRLKEIEIEARARLAREYEEIQSELAKRNSSAAALDVKWRDQQERAFQKAKIRLTSILHDEQRTIRQLYGELKPSLPVFPDGRSRDPSSGSQAQSQPHCPRLLRVRCQTLRAIKNKLPGGQYMLMFTLFDRLGGHPLRWCQFRDSSNYSYTAHTQVPQRHGGKFFELELKFNQDANKLYLVCPSYSDIRMSNCIIVELFALRGGMNKQTNAKGPAQQADGAALPVNQLAIGAVSSSKSKRREAVVAWGAFPLSYVNKQLIEGKFKMPLMRGEMNPAFEKYSEIEQYIQSNLDHWLCNLYFDASSVPVHAVYSPFGLRIKSLQYNVNNELKVDGIAADGKSGPAKGGKRLINKKLKPSLAMTLNAPSNRRSDSINELMFSLSPTENALAESEAMKRAAARDRAKELRAYKYSITNVERDQPVRQLQEKLFFLASELVSDFGFHRITTLDFWILLGLFLLTWWLRIYIHYFGQYYWIKYSLGVPAYCFDLLPYTVDIDYRLDPAYLVVSSATILAAGPITCLTVFAGLLVLSRLLQATLALPVTAYRFLLMFGVNCFFDPLWIVLVDCLAERWGGGDYFLLHNAFRSQEGLGYVGVLLTILIAAIVMAIAFVLNVVYLLNVHMDGRMLDIYRRLHAEESDLFIPQDLEISPRVLRHIISKSRQWKGSHGTTRKVLCTSYTVRDHRDPMYIDRMIHYSIYNVTPKQGKKPEQRELYRHFVRDSSGAIIEAFDSVESLGAENMKHIEDQMLYDNAMKAMEEGEREAEERMLQVMEAEMRAKDKRDAEEAAGRIKLALTRKSVKESGIGNPNHDPLYLDGHREEKDYEHEHEQDQEHMGQDQYGYQDQDRGQGQGMEDGQAYGQEEKEQFHVSQQAIPEADEEQEQYQYDQEYPEQYQYDPQPQSQSQPDYGHIRKRGTQHNWN